MVLQVEMMIIMIGIIITNGKTVKRAFFQKATVGEDGEKPTAGKLCVSLIQLSGAPCARWTPASVMSPHGTSAT